MFLEVLYDTKWLCILEECTKYGQVYHIHVDKSSTQVKERKTNTRRHLFLANKLSYSPKSEGKHVNVIVNLIYRELFM